jgi:protein CrcB
VPRLIGGQPKVPCLRARGLVWPLVLDSLLSMGFFRVAGLRPNPHSSAPAGKPLFRPVAPEAGRSMRTVQVRSCCGRDVKAVLIVALGGAVGSVARHLLSGWALHHSVEWRFPLGTFMVNIIGCVVVGILGGLVVKHDFFSPDVRLFLFTGITSGSTTFSAFGLETSISCAAEKFGCW